MAAANDSRDSESHNNAVDETSPIYVSDYRRKTLIAFLVLLAISAFLTIYILSVRDLDFLILLGFPYVVTITMAVMHLQLSNRVEFYRNYARIAMRRGETRDIQYVDLDIVKKVYDKYGRVDAFYIAPKGEEGSKTARWRVSNAIIGEIRKSVYDLIIAEIGGDTDLVQRQEEFIAKTSEDIRHYAEKTRPFAIVAAAASIPFFVGGYLLYQMFLSNGYNYYYYGTRSVFPVSTMNELYVLTLIGFGALIGAVVYLRPITKRLANLDISWFGRFPKLLLGILILLIITLPLALLAAYFLPLSDYPTGGIGFVAVELVGLTIVPLMVLMALFGIGVGSLAHRMGNYRGKLALVLCTILVCGAFASPYVGAMSGLGASPRISNTTVEITQLYLQISYSGNLTEGYLGPSLQAVSFVGGNGSANFNGGERWNTWISIPYDESYNATGHEVTSFITTTSGFSVLSTSPGVPFVSQPGVGLNVSYVLQVPNINYSGPVYIQISTM